MKWENSTVQLINWLVKAAGARYALCVDHDSVTVKKKNRPTNDLLLYFFLLEYSIDILDKKNPSEKPAFYYYYWTIK